MMKNLYPLIFFCLVSCVTSQSQSPAQSQPIAGSAGNVKTSILIPNGWTVTSYRKSSNCNFPKRPAPLPAVEGDFDGDGITDYAKILKRIGKDQEKLVVWLSSRGFDHPIVLDKIGESDFNRMMITLAHKNEKIESMCKRGYEETCGSGDQDEVVLKSDGLWFTLCESAASVFYWDPVKGKFLRQWYSD